MSHPRTDAATDVVFQVGTLAPLIDAKTQQLAAQLYDWGLPLKITGVLGEIKAPARDGVIYRVPFLDADTPGTSLLLDLPARLQERDDLRAGDVVTVVGSLTTQFWKNALNVRVQVQEVMNAPDRKVARVETSVLAPLKSNIRREFPLHRPLTITVVCSASQDAQVDEDFLGALGTVPAELHRMRVSMYDPQALVRAFEAIDSDIVVCIRGGGPSEDFAIFDRPDVLTALSACPAYRLVGLGHAGNTTLADVVADHAASTPTAAGTFLRARCLDEGPQGMPVVPSRSRRLWWILAVLVSFGAGLLMSWIL